MMGWVSVLNKERKWDESSLSAMVRMQQACGLLQARKRVFTRNQIYQDHDLGLPCLKGRNEYQ